MRRTKAERHHNDWMKIRKKTNLIKNVCKDEDWYDEFWENQKHRLSKEKPYNHYRAPKSKTDGYKVSDIKKFEAMDYSMEDEVLPY